MLEQTFLFRVTKIQSRLCHRSEPQPNRYHRTEEQGLRYNLIDRQIDRVLIEPRNSPSCRYCSEFGRVRKQDTLSILLKGFVPCACISDPLRTYFLRASYGVDRLRLLRAENFEEGEIVRQRTAPLRCFSISPRVPAWQPKSS